MGGGRVFVHRLTPPNRNGSLPQNTVLLNTVEKKIHFRGYPLPVPQNQKKKCNTIAFLIYENDFFLF